MRRKDLYLTFGVRLFLVMLFVGSGLAIWGYQVVAGSPWVTRQDRYVEQPVPFSHLHHVQGLKIDCRFCHTQVERSRYAGLPPSSVCMKCHSQILTDAPLLKPVRDSYAQGKGLPWQRVNPLPDYVFFDHKAHIRQGVNCSVCHGAMETMSLPRKAHHLKMSWCVDCHTNPKRAFKNQQVHGSLVTPEWNTSLKNASQACYACHR